MPDALIEFLLDESKWLAMSMVTAIAAVGALFWSQRAAVLPRRRLILWAMNLFYGCVIGMMGLGHLLAVGIKDARGVIDGAPLWLLYPMGVCLALPAGCLALRVGSYLRSESVAATRKTASFHDSSTPTSSMTTWSATSISSAATQLGTPTPNGGSATRCRRRVMLRTASPSTLCRRRSVTSRSSIVTTEAW